MTDYEPTRYWERLLGEQFDESGVGYPSLPVAINAAMYRSLTCATTHALGDDVRPGRVLDVGSGTGVWIDYWKNLAAESITGVDLTEAAVLRLGERFPDATFVQGDIGEATLPVEGRFDTISAMSVLLHITDDTRWRRAIENLADRLAPGGRLVLIEPLVAHHWWGPAFSAESNSRARGLGELTSALTQAGLTVEHVGPATVLLSNPVDTRTRLAWRALSVYWEHLVPRLGRGSAVAAPVLGALDRRLLRLVRNGPSAKLVVARRRSDVPA